MGYWAFFHAVNPTLSVYSFSADGNTWSTPQAAFPTSIMTPNVAAGQPSIWYYYDSVQHSTFVYVAAGDGSAEGIGAGTFPASGAVPKSNDTSGNFLFARRGQLCTSGVCPVGNINWDVNGSGGGTSSILRQQGTVRVQDTVAANACQVLGAGNPSGNSCNAGTGLCARYDVQAGHSAVVTYSPAGGPRREHEHGFRLAIRRVGRLHGRRRRRLHGSGSAFPASPRTWAATPP